MLEIIKVPIPKKGCVINSYNKNKIPYVYFTTSCYRNERNQPTNTRVLIGKKDLKTGLLIPNDKYFELFDMEIIVRKRGKNETKEKKQSPITEKNKTSKKKN